MLRKWMLALCFCLGIFGCGCSETTSDESSTASSKATTATTTQSADEKTTRDLFAMDTYITLTAYGNNAEAGISAAEACIQDLDARLSTGNSESEIAKLNATGSGTLSSDTSAILQEAITLYQDTDGAFNPLMYPIMQAWGFPTEKYRVPGKEELKKLRGLMGADYISYDEEKQEVTLDKVGMQIDLGGIAKGYTSSKVIDIFRKNGISSAVISLGGNVQTLNGKPDGSSWRVAVENPADTGSYIGVLSVKNKAVITSGGYERYFEQDGKTYHHIIDPSTGYPANNGLTSVTIVSDDGTLADGLSTSLFIMGPEKAQEYWKKYSNEFDMILVKDDGSIVVSEGIADSFTSDSDFAVIKNR